jgi:hypothetical protein
MALTRQLNTEVDKNGELKTRLESTLDKFSQYKLNMNFKVKILESRLKGLMDFKQM